MPEFEFEIYSNGGLIAGFVNKHDRDSCLNFLEEQYEDCKFTTE